MFMFLLDLSLSMAGPVAGTASFVGFSSNAASNYGFPSSFY